MEQRCSRCGQLRIVGKTWTEEVFATSLQAKATTITHTLMICPDADCQLKLEQELGKKESLRQAKVAQKTKDDSERRQRMTESRQKTAKA